MDATTLKSWRKTERERLIAARVRVAPAVLDSWRRRIDACLERSFPGLATCRLAFCWPIKGEYDARHLARTLRTRGALTALPVVVAPKTPLIFREWHPGIELAHGALDIPYPVDSPEFMPDAVLLPMNGWDAQGYRLGYGAGFFDRTLASLAKTAAGDRRLLRVGEARHHPSAVLGHPDGLRGHRARRLPPRSRRVWCFLPAARAGRLGNAFLAGLLRGRGLLQGKAASASAPA